MQGEHPAQAALMLLDHLNERDGEKHRHRIVTAGFNFERRADTLVKPFSAEQGKDRRGVRRANNRADQQPFHDVELKQPGRHHPGQAGGDKHPNGGEG